MRTIGLILAGAGLVAGLTACSGGSDDDGFGDKSAEDIAKTSKADMADLTSLKVSGTITSDGKDTTLDLQVGEDGNCTGSISVDSGTAQLLGVDGSVWIKPDEEFWRAQAGDSADQIISLVGDNWVVLPSEDDSFDEFCNVDQLLENILKDDDEAGESTYTKAGDDEVDGQDVIKVDNKDDKGTSTGYVLTDDPHYLVKIEKTEGDDTGSVTFSAFNEKFDVAAPPDDEIVDLSTVGS